MIKLKMTYNKFIETGETIRYKSEMNPFDEMS